MATERRRHASRRDTVLALEYALRNPSRVSRLILMNPAPVSAGQLAVLRKSYVEQLGSGMDRQREIMASAAYKAGDPDTVAARYRIHFRHGLRQAVDYDKLMTRMSAQFHAQGASGILKAWAIESRLYRDTWDRADYDLLPKLHTLRTPVLVIAGEHDFIPPAIAAQIAGALPSATLATIKDCTPCGLRPISGSTHPGGSRHSSDYEPPNSSPSSGRTSHSRFHSSPWTARNRLVSATASSIDGASRIA